MNGTLIRRGLVVLAVLGAVAGIAVAVWRYGYDQALDALAQRGEADLSLAADRLTGQLQRYQDVAVLLAMHPALDRASVRRDGPERETGADAILLRAVDRTGALNMVFVDPDGGVLARARPLTPDAIAAESQTTAREAVKHKLTSTVSPVFQLPAGSGTRQFMILRQESISYGD